MPSRSEVAGAALPAPPGGVTGKAGTPAAGTHVARSVRMFLAGCALGATLSLLLVTVFVLPARSGGGEPAASAALTILDPLLSTLEWSRQPLQRTPLSAHYEPPPIRHTMSDEELYSNAVKLEEEPLAPTIKLFPKMAFLFLVRGPVPLAPLWDRFFRGHEGKYSIFVHAHPDFEYAPRQVPHIFLNRNVPSQLVRWKDFSLVKAAKRLLANALRDRGNSFFVLVSDSCIPLFNFTFTYAHVSSSGLDYVGRGEDYRVWASSLEPEIRWGQLWKSMHWFTLRRDAALHVVADVKYYQKLRRHCNPDAGPPYCHHYFPDEFYVPTVLYNAPRFRNRTARRTLTYNYFPPHSAHPQVYLANNTNVMTAIKRMQSYTCRDRGDERRPCFLFSRKWDASALGLLLNMARIVSKY